MSISPTPWKVCHDANGDIFIAAADDTHVAEIGCPDDGAAEDARYLVAAVNAAAGTPVEVLEDPYS